MFSSRARRVAAMLLALSLVVPAPAVMGSQVQTKTQVIPLASTSCSITVTWYGSKGYFKGTYKFGPSCRTDLLDTAEYWHQIGPYDWTKVHGEAVPEVPSTMGNLWYMVYTYYCGSSGVFKVRLEVGGVVAYSSPISCPK